MSLGYDMSLPSKPPFMYIEKEVVRGDVRVIAFGAYNAMGLIGPEKGGVAVVLDAPQKAVLATVDVPYKPKERAALVSRLAKSRTATAIVKRAAKEDGFAWRYDVESVLRTLRTVASRA